MCHFILSNIAARLNSEILLEECLIHFSSYICKMLFICLRIASMTSSGATICARSPNPHTHAKNCGLTTTLARTVKCPSPSGIIVLVIPRQRIGTHDVERTVSAEAALLIDGVLKILEANHRACVYLLGFKWLYQRT